MMARKIIEMGNSQIVARFAEISLEQFEADEMDDISRFNKLYQEKEVQVRTLKNRNGDQRVLLTALYDHPNVQVRLNAAKSTLAVAPIEARAQIEAIAASKEFPQAGDAGMCLRALDEGIFKPT